MTVWNSGRQWSEAPRHLKEPSYWAKTTVGTLSIDGMESHANLLDAEAIAALRRAPGDVEREAAYEEMRRRYSHPSAATLG